MSVCQLTQTMSIDEITHWIAREQIDPIPDHWLMWRWMMSYLSRINFKDCYKPQPPSDFDFNREKLTEANNVEIMRAKCMGLAARARAGKQ